MSCISISGNVCRPVKYSAPRFDSTCREIGVYNNFSGELVKLAMANEAGIKRFILNKIKDPTSVDDIFQDAIMMLSKQREEELESISLKYVYGCVNIIIKRYCTTKGKDKENIIYYIENEETLYNDTSIAYQIEERDYLEYTDEELDRALKLLEGDRYKYEYDIFEVVYLKLMLREESEFERALKVLCGACSKDMNRLYKKIVISKEVMGMFLLLSNCENALSVLEKYVYGSEDIKRLVM